MGRALRAACLAAAAAAAVLCRAALAGEDVGRPGAERAPSMEKADRGAPVQGASTLSALLVRDGAPVAGAAVMARRLYRAPDGSAGGGAHGGAEGGMDAAARRLSCERDPETGIDPARLGREGRLGARLAWLDGDSWALVETGEDGRAAFEAPPGIWCVASRGWEPLAVDVPLAASASSGVGEAGLEVALKPQTLRVTKAIVTEEGDAIEAACAAGEAAVFAVGVELPGWSQELEVVDRLDPRLMPLGLVSCAADGRAVACAWEARAPEETGSAGWEVVMRPDLSGVAWGADQALRVEFSTCLSDKSQAGSLDNDALLLSGGARAARSNTVRLHWGGLPRTGDASEPGLPLAAAAGASLLAAGAAARSARPGGP